jgi:pSer/pThr/pTyr-binding forkhead associated (FHA) protein
VNLGRAHDNEVRVSDISVSRFHAKLSLVFYINYLTNKKKNQLMLKDLKSKFGTLILQKENLQITPEINRL